MNTPLQLLLGVKTDPIEYRYSYPWLFRLAAEEGVEHIQLGSTFEFYLLPDDFFQWLREQAEKAGVRIYSLFTAHRELGGFFRNEPGWESVARRMFERYIQIGGILGAQSVGHNPGAVLRDEMHTKPQGISRYLKHFKELMHLAHEQGIPWLTVEPMSCLAEPPTLPEEIRQMGEELTAYHRQHAGTTARAGFCADSSHGYADEAGNVVWDNLQTFRAALPYLYEVHLKNTDALFYSTFGFGEEERAKGVVQVERFRDLLHASAHLLPVHRVAGYLEISGPKLGRDYSDIQLERSLRESLRYLRETWCATPEHTPTSFVSSALPSVHPVRFSASLMCADQLNLESHVRRLEAMGVHYLHFDLMDAHFTPNMPVGLVVLEQLCQRTNLPFDVHLMVEENDFFVQKLLTLGVRMISVHVESARHLHRTLSLIRGGGARAGVALNPATPLSVLEYVLEELDFVLIMTVNPGFAGQKAVPQTLRKIADCRRFLDERGYQHIPIQVDGNVSFENIPKMVAAGADILVLGSSSLYHPGGTLFQGVQRSKARLELARFYGADVYICSEEEDVVARCREETGGEGPDIVITASASVEAHEQAIEMVAHRGYVNLFGGLPKGTRPMSVYSNTIHYKECFVTGSHGSVPRHHELAVQLLAQEKVRVAPLITHRFPLSQIHRAFEVMQNRDGMKVMIHPQEG